MGKIVRTLSEDGCVLCAALDSTDIVREVAKMHGSSPVVTAALGRLATAASMMGAMLKYKDDELTLRINGGGPVGTITAVSDYRGNVKCSVTNPVVNIPAKADGSLDVEAAVGNDGSLTVIKDMELKEPYCGQVPLISGNIAEDITSYYAASEQLPTVVALGISFGEHAEIEAAAGFMVQIVPPVSDKAIEILEHNLANMDGISDMTEKRLSPENIAMNALAGLGAEVLDSWECGYFCGCSREKTEKILISLGAEELQRLIDEQEETEVCCHFCNKKYVFSANDLSKLLKDAKK